MVQNERESNRGLKMCLKKYQTEVAKVDAGMREQKYNTIDYYQEYNTNCHTLILGNHTYLT